MLPWSLGRQVRRGGMQAMAEHDETSEWAQRHEAAWEITPLYEVVKGEGKTQTGYELRIYAQVDSQAEKAIDELTARVRRIAQEVVPAGELPLECEVRAYDEGEWERPETGFADEVVVPVALTFTDPAHPPTAETAAVVITAVEAKLQLLGLKPRAWDSRR